MPLLPHAHPGALLQCARWGICCLLGSHVRRPLEIYIDEQLVATFLGPELTLSLLHPHIEKTYPSVGGVRRVQLHSHAADMIFPCIWRDGDPLPYTLGHEVLQRTPANHPSFPV